MHPFGSVGGEAPDKNPNWALRPRVSEETY